MLKDVSFPHPSLFANILRKHLVLRKSKHWTFVKIFPWQWWRCSRFIAFLKGRASRQMHNFPFGFSTITRLFTQSVGFLIGSVMSRSIIRLSSFSSFGLSTCGTLRTGVTTGLTLPFTSIWWVVFKVPISPKQSWNSEKNVSLL